MFCMKLEFIHMASISENNVMEFLISDNYF